MSPAARGHTGPGPGFPLAQLWGPAWDSRAAPGPQPGAEVPTRARGSCSIAADFLPTFMYCLGSRDFEVVQTALRNLPEYTLLCQGESGWSRPGPQVQAPGRRPEAPPRARLTEPGLPRRARGRAAAPGLPGGHVRPGGHQRPDLRGPEDPAHGGRDVSLRAGPATSGRPLGGLQPAPRGCPAAPRGGPRPVSGLGTSKAGQGSMQSPRWRPLASRGGPAPRRLSCLQSDLGTAQLGGWLTPQRVTVRGWFLMKCCQFLVLPVWSVCLPGDARG